MYGSTVYSWVRQKAYLRWALAALSASPLVNAPCCARCSDNIVADPSIN